MIHPSRRVRILFGGLAASIGVVLGTAALLAVLGGEPKSDVSASTETTGAGLPVWVRNIPVRAPGEAEAAPAAEVFRPVGGTAADGTLYMIDAVAGSLLVLPPEGGVREVPLGTPGGGSLRVPRFSDLVATGTGVLLVADLANGRLWNYATDGRFLGSFLSDEQRRTSALGRPSGVAVDRDGRILVTDIEDQRVKVFNKSGVLVQSFGGQGFAPGSFSFPSDVAADTQGRIFVADSENRRVQVFDSGGRFLRAFRDTDTPDGLVLPRSLAVDRYGLVHVADTFGERVSAFTAEGVFVGSYGFGAGGERSLSLPEGVAVAGPLLVVGNRGNGRLVVFSR